MPRLCRRPVAGGERTHVLDDLRGEPPERLAVRRCHLTDLDDDLDLDGRVEGKDGDTYRAPRMPPGIAEHLAQQLARTVDDARLPGERRSTRDEPDDLDHSAHPVEVAPGLLVPGKIDKMGYKGVD